MNDLCLPCSRGDHRSCELVGVSGDELEPVVSCGCEHPICRAAWLVAEGSVIDQQAQDAAAAEDSYLEALELDEENVEAWGRYICFLITRSRVAQAEEMWDKALDALGRVERTETFYRQLNWPVAVTALQRALLVFARWALDDVIDRYRDVDVHQQLVRYLDALETAEQGVTELPMAFLRSGWEQEVPHLLPATTAEGPLRMFLLGRFDGADEDNLYASVQLDEGGSFSGGSLTLPHESLETFDGDTPERAIGSFFELGFYGNSDQGVIRFHTGRLSLPLPVDLAFPTDRYLADEK